MQMNWEWGVTFSNVYFQRVLKHTRTHVHVPLARSIVVSKCHQLQHIPTQNGTLSMVARRSFPSLKTSGQWGLYMDSRELLIMFLTCLLVAEVTRPAHWLGKSVC